MADRDAVADPVGTIYEASMDVALWPVVLDRIATHFDASFVGLADEDLLLGQSAARYHTNSRVDQQHIAAYASEYANNPDANDIYSFLPKMLVGRTVLRSNLQKDSEFVATNIYKYWLSRVGMHHMSITNIELNPRRFVFLNVSRDKSSSNFQAEEVGLIQSLAPHLRRVFAIHRRLAVAEAERQALDALPWGVLFIDAMGAVLSHNRAAEEILAAQDGLVLRRGRLFAAAPAEMARLEAAVRQAALSANGLALPPDALALPRPSRLRPLSVIVAPVGVSSPVAGERPPVALVFVADPERRVEPQATVLRRLYGLTAAEATLALALLQGDGLSEAADRLGIRLSTAKTQLQSVFAKTDTRRQAELVKLVLQGPAGLRLD